MMDNLREWDISPASPVALQLAADARLNRTSYTNDQTWDVRIGRGDTPAIALHTKYGFRVGLASLVPMWLHDGRIIYQAQTYHRPSAITHFAPNYIAANAKILSSIRLHAEHIALSSQAIGGIYTLHNTSDKAVTLRFELFGHVGARGKEQKLAIITMADGGHALSMTSMPTLSPVVLMEGGTASDLSSRSASPKIGTDISIPAAGTVTMRWVHVGQGDVRRSLQEARQWLAQDWTAFRAAIDHAARAIPQIQTSNLDWDLAIAASYNYAHQAVLRPAGILPHETLIAQRTPEVGFSLKGNGTDYPRTWAGQDPLLSYMIAPILGAEGVIRNYIAAQRDDGYIDLKPSPSGENSNLLCLPLLARTAWHIYLRTENRAFVTDVFPALRRFFDHWLAQDDDGDGYPEWHADAQTGYAALPTFAPARDWSQGADITTVETPDLLVYLIKEAESLAQMAHLLNDDAGARRLRDQADALRAKLEALWQGDHYAYRDRDTDITTNGMILLEEGAGDQTHVIDQALAVPNRLIVKVIGGISHTPQITLHVEGTDHEGNTISEQASTKQFTWIDGQGVYTTQRVFSHIHTIRCDGLSRVYHLYTRTMDTTARDINALLPLWAGIPDERAQSLVSLLSDSAHFLRANGITMTDASGAYFDPSNADGAGGIWLYWNTILCEGLIDNGQGALASDVTKTILKMLVDVLSTEHEFGQFYHSDVSRGLGEKNHMLGVAPLLLLNRLFGVRVISSGRVWLDKTFAWGRGVTIRQHGVYVRRTNKRIKIVFPSGYEQELDPTLAEAQYIDDPDAQTRPAPPMIDITRADPQQAVDTRPEEAEPAPAPRVIIEVEYED